MTDDQSFGVPDRIVSLSPSNTEILFAVGAGNRVVGVTDDCDYPEQLLVQLKTKKTITVGGYWNTSVDTIASLKPDLILVSSHACTVKTDYCKTGCSRRCEEATKVAKKLERLGFNVLTLSPHSLDDVLEHILLVGKATGNLAEARVLVASLEQRVDAATANLNCGSELPKVYFEVWNSPYISVNSKTWIGNVISLAGGKNVFEDSITEWPIIQPQEIVKRNPDVMVFPVISRVPRFWGSFETVTKRKGWQNITAIQNGRLYEVPRDYISRPGPRLVDALELLVPMVNLC
jgi:iron complex transport system substrate-binding protein